MLEEMYVIQQNELDTFGNHVTLKAGDKLDHCKEQRIAVYKASGDGQDVEVYVKAYPSRFYKIKALGGVNSTGDSFDEYTLSTGSGPDMRRLSATIAQAISEGMLICQ